MQTWGLALSAHDLWWTPGLCWAIRSMLLIPWGEGRREYVDGGGGRPPQPSTLTGVTCDSPLLWLQDVH